MRGSTEFMKDRSRIRGVEVGVRAGDHARELLEHLDVERLYLVDSYEPYVETPIGSPPMEWNLETQQVFQREAFKMLGHDPRVSFLKQSSDLACSWMEDKQFDFILVEARVVARQADTNRAGYIRRALVYRASGGSATMQGSVSDVMTVESDANWDATIDVSGNDVRVRVTGFAATTIYWACSLSLVEVST